VTESHHPRPEPLEVLAVGSSCKIGFRDLGRVPGVILGVAIYSGLQVQYRVAWWDGRVRKSEWVDACEVTPDDDQRLRIGFAAADRPRESQPVTAADVWGGE